MAVRKSAVTFKKSSNTKESNESESTNDLNNASLYSPNATAVNITEADILASPIPNLRRHKQNAIPFEEEQHQDKANFKGKAKLIDEMAANINTGGVNEYTTSLAAMESHHLHGGSRRSTKRSTAVPHETIQYTHYLPLLIPVLPLISTIFSLPTSFGSDLVQSILVLWYLKQLISLPWTLYYHTKRRRTSRSIWIPPSNQTSKGSSSTGKELRALELLALAGTIAGPAVGAKLLSITSIGGGSDSVFSYKLFLLASAVGPLKHLFNLLTDRATDLQRQSMAEYESAEWENEISKMRRAVDAMQRDFCGRQEIELALLKIGSAVKRQRKEIDSLYNGESRRDLAVMHSRKRHHNLHTQNPHAEISADSSCEENLDSIDQSRSKSYARTSSSSGKGSISTAIDWVLWPVQAALGRIGISV